MQFRHSRGCYAASVSPAGAAPVGPSSGSTGLRKHMNSFRIWHSQGWPEIGLGAFEVMDATRKIQRVLFLAPVLSVCCLARSSSVRGLKHEPLMCGVRKC